MTDTRTNHANSQDWRAMGLSPLPGVNAFQQAFASRPITPQSLKLARDKIANEKKRESRKGMTVQQKMALALRSDAERKADREAKALAFKTGFSHNFTPDKVEQVPTKHAHGRFKTS